jgi:formylglycine-generating enzyme required for sulfatase activity
MKSLLISALAAALFFCGIPRQKNLIFQQNPPLLDDKLLVDAYELSNLDYRIYESWVLATFGEQVYQKCLPDTSVWRSQAGGEVFAKNYHRHPAFDNYPVVGLTYEQVTEYAKWRSDRVSEIILTKKNILKKEGEPFKNEAALKKYVEALDKMKDIALPQYRLLTPEEWSFYATANAPSDYGIDENNKKIQAARKEALPLFNYHVGAEMKKNDPLLSPVNAFLPNNFKLYNMVGNVAEMTATKGVSKGGSFIHNLEDCKISKDIAYEKPENWLGVRFVAVVKN